MKNQNNNLSVDEQIKRNLDEANRLSNLALVLAVVAFFINVLAYLDKIVAFVHYLLSYLN
jgi:hypothetical protein